jgi:hypothetical protein
MAMTVTTPWGKAAVVEELGIPQEAAGKDFTTLVQLIELEGGERLVRFAYTTGGVARRGPVTLRGADLERLRAGLRECRELGKAMGLRAR